MSFCTYESEENTRYKIRAMQNRWHDAIFSYPQECPKSDEVGEWGE